MKKLIYILFIFLLTAIFVTGCGTTKKAENDKIKAALLTSGPIDDGGWNTAAYNGLLKLKDDGFYTSYSDNVTQSYQMQTMEAYCESGYDFIIGHGFEWADTIKILSKKYPDIKFLQVAGDVNKGQDLDNVVSVEYSAYELGYLGGSLSSMLTKKKSVGFVGAENIPTTAAEVDSLEGILRKNDPNIKFKTLYTGSWTDVAAGKKATEELIDNGADVIIGIGDACDKGAIEAIKERKAKGEKIWFIGWSGDLYKSYKEDFIASSSTQGISETIALYGNQLKDGSFKSGGVTLGTKDKMLYYGEFSPAVPEDIKEKSLAIEDELIKGTVTKKSIYEDLNIKTPYYYQYGE